MHYPGKLITVDCGSNESSPRCVATIWTRHIVVSTGRSAAEFVGIIRSGPLLRHNVRRGAMTGLAVGAAQAGRRRIHIHSNA